MKVKHIWSFMLIFYSLFVMGCAKDDVESNEVNNEVNKKDIDNEVRNAVMDYMEQEDWSPEFYPATDWENASVKKITADDRYKNLDELYIGKEIFVVTIVDELAEPLVLLTLIL